jgi:hypothetical protein
MNTDKKDFYKDIKNVEENILKKMCENGHIIAKNYIECDIDLEKTITEDVIYIRS